ncbi:hypothetical protein GMRT_13841 [Giardia muris]|uniref:Uncharacterized protein n=1 Tax=Giardia muris TaxID=5742 RepID=A0A4Z1SNH9_GIAMU|nr:hypothetical protein GMRT_13841 [Giardia muris]|eukprot:TNJ27332.1 hypothetical protein GMRT_13841 [Giardia muris]
MPLTFLRTWGEVCDHYNNEAEKTFAAIMTIIDEFCTTMEGNDSDASLDFSDFTKYGAVQSGCQYLVIANFGLNVVQFLPFEGTVDPQSWADFIKLTESDEFRSLFV